jgi:hypothetical protein
LHRLLFYFVGLLGLAHFLFALWHFPHLGLDYSRYR